MTAKVKYVDELIADLKSLKPDAQIMALIAVSGAFVIEANAKIVCPVDTGFLRDSIHTGILEASATHAIASVGTNTEYAPYVEFGTWRWKGKSFLRAAFDGHVANATAVMQKTARKLIGSRLGK